MKKKQKIKREKKKFILKKELETSLKYIKESKNYIIISIGLFMFFFFLGYIFPYIASEETLDPILEQIKAWIEDIINKTKGFGFFEMWYFIFSNNALVSILSIFSGVFLGIFPIILIISNGFVIGIILSLVSSKDGFISILYLLPHGIFELPAIIISFSIGIKLGSFIFARKKWKELKRLFFNSIRTLVFIILPLLIIAAFIESLLIIYFS
ncbi:MAG: stage II sporulation protein M [Candidatus Pacearchaeota archaeon]